MVISVRSTRQAHRSGGSVSDAAASKQSHELLALGSVGRASKQSSISRCVRSISWNPLAPNAVTCMAGPELRCIHLRRTNPAATSAFTRAATFDGFTLQFSARFPVARRDWPKRNADNTSKERDSASRTRKAGLSASAQMTAALGWAARDRREDLPSAGGGRGIHPTHIVGADKGGECQGCAR